MKITLDNVTFNEAVTWVTKNYDSKDDKAYVALVVDGKKSNAYLSHGNSKSFMKKDFQLLEVEEFDEEVTKLAIEGLYLKRLSDAIGGGKSPATLTLNDGELTIKTSNGDFTLPQVETVVSLSPKIKKVGEANNRIFFDTLQRISKICDSNNASYSPVLGAVDVKLDSSENEIVMMATDKYAFSEIIIPFEKSDYCEEFIEKVPHVMLTADNARLIAASKDPDEIITFIYEESAQKFGYQFSDSRIALFSLPDFAPIPYANVKANATKDIDNSVTVNVSELQSSIRTLSNLAWTEDDINLSFSGNEIILTDNSKKNSIVVKVENANFDEECSVIFMRSVINESFSPITTSKMNIRWKNSNSPFVFEPLLDDGEVLDNVLVFMMTKRS